MATIPASENEFPEVLFSEGAAPAAPGTGLVKAYAKSDGLLYSKDDAGAETALGATAHIADTTDAHDASAVSFDPTGATNITATEVQGALDELDAAIAGGGISATIVDAAGDLIVGTAADTVARLALGATNGMALMRVGGALAWGLPPGHELHHSTQSGSAVSITSTTSATPTAILAGASVSYDGTAIWIMATIPDFLINSATVDRLGLCGIYEDGALLATAGAVAVLVANRTNRNTVTYAIKHTPSAASHTYSVGGWKQNSGDTVQANGFASTCTLRITKA